MHVEVIDRFAARMRTADAGGIPVLKGGLVADVKGGKRVDRRRACRSHATSPAMRWRCRAAGARSSISPATRAPSPCGTTSIAAFLPPDVGAGLHGGGLGQRRACCFRECLADGAEQGGDSRRAISASRRRPIAVPPCRDEAYRITPLWWVKESTGKAFVDYQNDVTAKDLPLAAREGYRDIELAKRYTTTGMATDQGKLGNVNAIAILAEATGKSIAEVGTTTFRPFYTPVSFGAFAGPFTGHHFQPVRKTPLHDWAEELGAVFVETGLWMRSSWFPLPHEEDWLESVIREVKAVRERVGLCDVSTLGKIDVQGPDAGEFLNRLYCNTFSTLAVGKARYGLMLREDGIVFDDGTTSRLARRSLSS